MKKHKTIKYSCLDNGNRVIQNKILLFDYKNRMGNKLFGANRALYSFAMTNLKYEYIYLNSAVLCPKEQMKKISKKDYDSFYLKILLLKNKIFGKISIMHFENI